MSLINTLILGSDSCNSINWMQKIQEGKLQGVITQLEGRKKCYRIDLQNKATDNLSGVALLIEQLYANEVYNFELAGFNCDVNAWSKLLNRISRKVDEKRNPDTIDFKIAVDPERIST